MQHYNLRLLWVLLFVWRGATFELTLRLNKVTKIYISCKVTHDDKTVIYVQTEKRKWRGFYGNC